MTEPTRPAPQWEAPAGYEHVPIEEGPDWKVERVGQCRFMVNRRGCGRPAVAALDRGQRAKNWWRYCPEHMYGRWIENGRVMYWGLREVEG